MKKKTAAEQTPDRTEDPDVSLMTFWEHVEELRKRLFIALLALGAATAGSFAFAEKVIILLAEPAGSIEALQSIEVTENVAVFMRVSLLCGVMIAMPIILYELLAFILPGLKRGEKRWIFITIFFGTLLFLAGAAFAYFIMLPASVTFLINFLSVETKPRLIFLYQLHYQPDILAGGGVPVPDHHLCPCKTEYPFSKNPGKRLALQPGDHCHSGSHDHTHC